MAYRVHRGDTLTKIAGQFNTTVSALAKANGIRNVNLIRTGQMLKVPGRGDSFQAEPKKTGGAKTGGTTTVAGKAGKFGPKAAHLANVAKRVASQMNTRGWCARGVFNSLQAAGLRIPRSASAYMAARTLANDNRFREVKLTDAQIRKLPPGAIIVSGPYNSRGNPHGHIAVTLGNGREASDHLGAVGTSGTQRVFIPIG
jgi:LysM repeat protein